MAKIIWSYIIGPLIGGVIFACLCHYLANANWWLSSLIALGSIGSSFHSLESDDLKKELKWAHERIKVLEGKWERSSDRIDDKFSEQERKIDRLDDRIDRLR